uniref:Uncharacterized protein n=2 Tax=viral metagenome TaxID=1070528 RepID=A0A6M3LIJ0_9ZZZZ
MYSLKTIKSMSREAAEIASEENLVPFIVEKEDLYNIPPFPFPNLGDYVPTGWTLDKEYFVDSSGFGSEEESALTASQFLKEIKTGKGYALTECGQFQVYVGEYYKKGD